MSVDSSPTSTAFANSTRPFTSLLDDTNLTRTSPILPYIHTCEASVPASSVLNDEERDKGKSTHSPRSKSWTYCGLRPTFPSSYKILAPVPAACPMKKCFNGPNALTALSPTLLNGTSGPLSTEYNLCNLSTTPIRTWFLAYLSAL